MRNAWRNRRGQRHGAEFASALVERQVGAAGIEIPAAGVADDIVEKVLRAGWRAILVADGAVDIAAVGARNHHRRILHPPLVPSFYTHACERWRNRWRHIDGKNHV